MSPSELSIATIASPGYTHTSEKQDSDLKSYLIKIIQNIKEDINNYPKEIQELSRGTSPLQSEQHQVARAHSQLTTSSYPQHPPRDLKTSGEWNTTSAPIQSRRT